MQWKNKDMAQYIQEKAYVDTLVIPLLPYKLTGGDSILKDAFQSEALTIITRSVEKVLAGRILLLPQYVYLRQKELQIEVERLNKWVEDALDQPFKHVFFVSFDVNWKKLEPSMNGSFIWLQGTEIVDPESKEMQKFVQAQVNPITELIQSYWD